MTNKMDRNEMIKLLHELDRELKSNLEIEICGASCAILNHGLERASTDIDVMRSSIPFYAGEIKKAINDVALNNNTESLWINDQSKEVFKHIPEDYAPDTDPIPGEEFKFLKPKVISKADFVITKLAHHQHLRQWDISDLKTLSLSESDVRSVFRKVDRIAEKQHYDALMIEGYFKSIRSDLVKDENGYSYTTAKTIAKYAQKRYGIKTPESDVSDWQETLDNLTMKAGAIIAKIDLNAAELIKKGDRGIAKRDRSFRAIREKSMDYGLGL
jgi:hypothetical protein